MAEGLRIRRAVRAIVLDPVDRVLLVRFEFPHVVLWAAPGGGLEPGEHPHDALRRELIEETGLTDPEIGPVIWTRRHVFQFLDGTYDGQAESFYLVRTGTFDPRPAMSWRTSAGSMSPTFAGGPRTSSRSATRSSLPDDCPS